MKTYRVGFSETTGRSPKFIEAESLQVIEEGKKVYFRDFIGTTLSVYSEVGRHHLHRAGGGSEGMVYVSDRVPLRLRLGWCKSYGLYINPET